MRVTSQILNAALDTLETRTSRCHSLGYQMSGCVTNVKYTHKNNALYLANIMSNFFMISHFCFTEVIYR